MAPRTRFLVVGFVAGVLTVFAAQRARELMHNPNTVAAPSVARSQTAFPKNQEFESIERSLRDPSDPQWNLLKDMQPCFPGSKLCFLLSGPAIERDLAGP